MGTLLVLVATCAQCPWRWTWASQPFLGETPAGNILVSTAILMAGATPAKVLRIFDQMHIACFCTQTYFRHQSDLLIPSINKVWLQDQATHLTRLQRAGQGLQLGGDGRDDSPGHSAKFGTNTMMDLDHNVVLDVQTVQVKNQICYEYFASIAYIYKSSGESDWQPFLHTVFFV